MRLRVSFSFMAALLALTCCAETKVTTEVPPGPKLPEGDGPGTPLGGMCSNLRKLGCPEGEPKSKNGKTRTCFQWTTMAQDTSPFPIECVTNARTQDAVRACGDKNREITFRCVAP